MAERVIREILEKHRVSERAVSKTLGEVLGTSSLHPHATTLKKGEVPHPGTTHVDLETGVEKTYIAALALKGNVPREELPRIAETLRSHHARLRENGYGYLLFGNTRRPEDSTRFVLYLYSEQVPAKITQKEKNAFVLALRRAAHAWVPRKPKG